MPELFDRHTLDQVTQSLANFMPNGCVWSNKNLPDTIQHKLLRGLSGELQRVEETLIEWTSQFDPRTTTDFIQRWERVVGIPDGCFLGTEELEIRRKHVVAKFLSIGVTTEQDFIDLAAFLGVQITIEHLPEESFLLPYDMPFDLEIGAPQSRFVMVVVGIGVTLNVPPYPVPFTPGSAVDSPIACLFDKLKPANTFIIYRETPLLIERITEGGSSRITEDGRIRILE